MPETSSWRTTSLVRTLTWVNLAYLPLCLLAIVLGLVIDSDFFKQPTWLARLAAGLLLGWLVLTPAAAAVALALNRRLRWRPATWINLSILLLWLGYVVMVVGAILKR